MSDPLRSAPAWSFSYDVRYTFPSGAAGGNPSTGVTIVNGLLFGVTIGGPDNGNTGAQILHAVKP